MATTATKQGYLDNSDNYHGCDGPRNDGNDYDCSVSISPSTPFRQSAPNRVHDTMPKRTREARAPRAYSSEQSRTRQAAPIRVNDTISKRACTTVPSKAKTAAVKSPSSCCRELTSSAMYYCDDQHRLRRCADLRMDLENGIVSINDRDRLVLGRTGTEILK
ncbi:hypothetical protein K440DRAFT_641495 [Wilcoxina mikolae CBS 423.85]|nr:hypothetical protein K440DRAFT_641495 [Wilcoxina mikolae CBS 423.85]